MPCHIFKKYVQVYKRHEAHIFNIILYNRYSSNDKRSLKYVFEPYYYSYISLHKYMQRRARPAEFVAVLPSVNLSAPLWHDFPCAHARILI